MTKTYTITHKFCGMTTTIEGYDKWDAFRKAGLDMNTWVIVEEA